MLCCGKSGKILSELEEIRQKAKEYARKKAEIVTIYKLFGFYKYGLTLPSDAVLIEYVSPHE